jgi:hypothetical protein
MFIRLGRICICLIIFAEPSFQADVEPTPTTTQVLIIPSFAANFTDEKLGIIRRALG